MPEALDDDVMILVIVVSKEMSVEIINNKLVLGTVNDNVAATTFCYILIISL